MYQIFNALGWLVGYILYFFYFWCVITASRSFCSR